MVSNFQTISLSQNSSFTAKEVDGEWFNNDLHWHEENELIYFKNCDGFIYTNNNKFLFNQNDILFWGNNSIHRYQINNIEFASAIVVQFSTNCFGTDFMFLPECQPINKLLYNAKQGLRFYEITKNTLQLLIRRLLIANGIDRLVLLLQCLQAMSVSEGHFTIFEQPPSPLYQPKSEWFERILQFTEECFQSHITLQQAASAVCMSIPSFCYYFKQYTNKTYIEYLNEVRINFACRQLRETNEPVADIGYESGYNTIAHFHRQFYKLKNTTPLQYRRAHRLLPHAFNLKDI